MADSKENYWWDLGSERVKALKPPSIFCTFSFVLTRRICLTTKAFLVGDHFLYSNDLSKLFSSITLRRNNILITPRVKRVKIKAGFHVMKIPHILNLFIVTFVSVFWAFKNHKYLETFENDNFWSDKSMVARKGYNNFLDHSFIIKHVKG